MTCYFSCNAIIFLARQRLENTRWLTEPAQINLPCDYFPLYNMGDMGKIRSINIVLLFESIFLRQNIVCEWAMFGWTYVSNCLTIFSFQIDLLLKYLLCDTNIFLFFLVIYSFIYVLNILCSHPSKFHQRFLFYIIFLFLSLPFILIGHFSSPIWADVVRPKMIWLTK